MTKNHKNNKNVGLSNALEDLDQAFASLEVKPLSRGELGRIAGGTLGCNTSGATCNFKCGPTNFWECPTEAGGC